MTSPQLELVATGFAFAEGPRWSFGSIFVTDIHDDAIKKVSTSGEVTTVVQLDAQPISLGFLSSGEMVISEMSTGRLLGANDDELRVIADLGPLSKFDWGDVVIDASDRIYIANQGMSYPGNMPSSINSAIYLVDDDGPRKVAENFLYANGLAITPNERTLVVAESFGHRLWTLLILDDGALGPRTLLAQLPETDNPDGVCCDAEGAVWTAVATGRAVVRVDPSGRVTHRLSTGDHLAIGCILGGLEGHDLYITTATTPLRGPAREQRASALLRTRVAVPAGGRP